ncbi:SDR family oxidoreductase [Nocardiopsis sp. RSe5-2]|uniref:SDR family oxidoreductase n=1 Tax=Nocardiopsis endophytica TaxID=3018445 RepID=A0ABT4UDG4_9ACTN|nr:SDR family oxidoreductase [Nocardiopsis endophytica]MDA2815027.1 SDR family oxidoreductase [Nocardiopsis endophytica]
MDQRPIDPRDPVPERPARPLQGRTALVTGVSRRDGIGYAVARRLASYGASVFCHHYRPHDAEQPWGADDTGAVLEGVRAARTDPQARVGGAEADLAAPGAPHELFEAARAFLGHVDVLVCNHARSGGDADLAGVTEAMLDGHWAVDARSPLMLAQAFAAAHDGRPGGRVVFFTSGQGQGPMPGEIAYAAAKGALAAITLTVADELADRGITVNTVNPGPVQTGYLPEEVESALMHKLPMGRVGRPDDPARLIAWLATDESRWVTGQVFNSEGGFARWRDRP